MKALQIPKTIKPDAVICITGEEFVLLSRQDKQIVQKVVAPGAVRQAFASQPVDSGWLPAGVNRWGSGPRGEWMLRWHAPALYPVVTSERKKHVKTPMPALVFFGQGSKYYIWATAGDKFEPKAKLFNAPCANVNDLGLICWGGGNEKLDVRTGFDTMWKLFWEAPFSSNWSNGKSRKHPAAVNNLLVELVAAKATKYPDEDLTPLTHRFVSEQPTLGSMVELVTRRGEEWV